MKTLSSTLIASLLLNGIALPVGVRAEVDTSQVCATDTFKPEAKTPDEINRACGEGDYAEKCRVTRTNLVKWNEQYSKIAEDSCQERSKSISKINELNQSASYAEVKTRAEQGIADINKLIEANRRIREGIPKQSIQNAEALTRLTNATPAAPVGTKTYKSWGRSLTRSEILDAKSEGVQEADKPILSNISDSKIRSQALAQFNTLKQSQEFFRALMLEDKKNRDAVAKLTEAKDNAAKNIKNTQTTDGGTKSSDSGFNPMSLLPLAAPLAGLLMQQKQQSSGLSDPTTPTNPYGNTAPAPLAGTSLDPKSSGSQSIGAKLENPQKPDAQMHMPEETYAGGGGAVEPFGGDITNGNGESKSPVLGGAGSYSANSGGGASDSSGSSTAPGKAERKPASGTHSAGEEGLIGAGGGGGGYSAPTDTAAEADGGMKDMLQDMEATLEDVPTGLFAEIDQQNSNGGVAPENSESLFPRVRACYVRNLKKGFVLNGLGEKLPESDSR